MKKKLFSFLFLVFFSLLLPFKSFAEGDKIRIYFFYGKGCPHCAEEEEFLEKMKEKYPDLEVESFEIWYNRDNQKKLAQVEEELGVTIRGVPFTVISDKYLQGWGGEETSGVALEEEIQCAMTNGCTDLIGQILKNESTSSASTKNPNIPEKINVPILGEIQTKNLSLPALALLMGVLDGFNPCAMWVLIFLISLLLGMKDKKRMWFLGLSFIIASAFSYFLFMAAWLNLLLFVGFLIWVRALIGFVALGGGTYSIREFFKNPESGCKVTGEGKKKKTIEKLKELTQEKKFWVALAGIVALAFAVNLVELICSAGLPAIFTQVLTLSNLSQFQYYLYILLYIFFFMLDDLIIFIISMKTMELTGVTTKYSRYSHLIGGILMLVIGVILIIKPELLMFG